MNKIHTEPKKIKVVALVVAACIMLNLMPTFVIGNLFKGASAADPDFESDEMQIFDITAEGLQNAIDRIASTGTDDEAGTGRIILDKDYNENIVIPDNTFVVIDLNGYTLRPVVSDSVKSHIIVYGNLKLKDSGETGKLQSDGVSDIRGIDIVNGGRAILDGIVIDSYKSSMNGGGVIVEDHGKVELKGSTVQNCESELQGGGLYAYQGDCVEIENSALTDNKAKNGGGIYYYRTCENGMTASYSYDGLILKNNTAEESGGGLYVQYPLTIQLTNSHIDSNTAAQGGGMYFRNTVNLISDKSTFSENEAQNGHGGSIYMFMTTSLDGSQVSMTECKVNNNTASGSGAGIFFHNALPKVRNKLTLDKSELNGNQSHNRGGAVYAFAKTDFVLTQSTVSGNSADFYGGGIFMEGGQSGDNRSTFSMVSSTITGNTLTTETHTHSGAGLYLGSSIVVNLNSGEISYNTAAISGGGAYFATSCEVYVKEGMNVHHNSTMYHTYGWKAGNGFYLYRCSLTMTGGVFSENNCLETLSRGGGLFLDGGTAIITGGQVINNETSSDGAGIYFSGATVDISGNFYVAGNHARGSGGGIFFNGCIADLGGEFTVENNVSNGNGGAMYFESTTVDIREDVLIQKNRAGSGGGIFGSNENLNFHMMGGKITENTVTGSGGGVYFNTRRKLGKQIRFTGGEISNNTANGSGGGICVVRIGGNSTIDNYYKPAYAAQSIEISTAMTISGNTAGSNGGGVYMGDAGRVELYNGGKIIGNKANYGGGIFVSGNGYYYRDYLNAKENKEGETEALEVYGGELHDNVATTGGRDIYVGESADLRYYVPSYMKVVKASSMENADSKSYWYDENEASYKTTELNNKTKVDNEETPKYSIYTFGTEMEAVASIGEKVYPSLQAAINAVADGTVADNNIKLLKSHRETVVVPDGVTANVEMNGFSLYGEKQSVINVQKGAELNLKDSVGTSEISQGRGSLKGTETWGGGVLVEGTMRMENISVINNTARWGTAVAVYGKGELELVNVIIRKNNYSDNSSMVRVENATLTMEDCEITDSITRNIYVNGTSNVTLTDTTIKNTNGNNGAALWIEGTTTANINNCQIYDNICKNGYGMIYVYGSNCRVYVNETTIHNNQSTYAPGIYIYYGRVYLSNSVVTENVSTGETGGVYLANGYSYLYMKNSQIYKNKAASYGNDLRINGGSYFINENEDGTDSRAVESFGLEEFDCWVDDQTGIYYVTDKEAMNTQAADYQNIEDDLTKSTNHSVIGNHYLSVAKSLDGTDPVAEFTDTGEQFVTLKKAISSAVSRENDVEIRLLKDITENVVINPNAIQITVDFNGHTITSAPDSNQVFYIYAANVCFRDSVGGGKILGPEENKGKQPRGIYHNGGKLTIEDIEVSGFDYTGNGAGLYSTSGVTVNQVFYPSEVYLKSGSICNNTASAAGGGIYFNSSANSHSVFEMTGGNVSFNESSGHGAGIHLHCGDRMDDYAVLTIAGGTIEGNVSTAGSGGGIYYIGYNNVNDTDNFQIYGCLIKGNRAVNYGGILAERAGNKNYPFILGKEDVKTVFDGNHSTNTYAAGYCYNVLAGTQMMLAQNVEVKNHTTGSSNASLYLQSQKVTVRNFDVHDNTSVGSDAILRVAGGELLVEDSIFHDNTAKTTAAGLVIQNPENTNIIEGTKLVRNIKSYHNSASGGSGMWDNNLRDVTYENCEVYDNFARDDGNWIFANSGYARTKTLIHCHIHDNKALRYGGGIATSGLGGATIVFKDSVIENNTAQTRGGGIYTENGGNTFIIDDGAEIRNNTSYGSGGGLQIYYSSLLIRGGKIRDNHSVSTGGGICWSVSSPTCYLTMTGGVVENNVSDASAGGIYVYGYSALNGDRVNVTLSGGEIRNNKAGSNAGGLLIESNINWNYYNYETLTVRITGTRITGNFAKNNGGGVYNASRVEDTVIRDDALITNNSAGNLGGGLFVAGRLTNVILEDFGKLYGNQAAVGNDIFIEYNSSYRSSNMWIEKASDMFKLTEKYKGIGWLDETKGTVTADIIKIRPLGRSYPYTINYRPTNKIVAVYNGTEYETVQEAVEALAASGQSGEVIMVDDSVESVTIGSGVNVNLNLNGHTLRGAGASAITSRGQLEITDNKRKVEVGENTYEKPVTEGRITGHAAVNGGGIYVVSGKVVMRQGIISDCMAGANRDDVTYGGGAVCIAGGEFIMYDGLLTDNVARNGAAVLVRSPSGKFTMYGGTIKNNTSSAVNDPKTIGRGAVCNVGGEINIYGGTITSNIAYQGGGLFNQSGVMNVVGLTKESGPIIENNIGGYAGGGIYAHSGSVRTANAVIRNNKTTYSKHDSVYHYSYINQGAGGGLFAYNANIYIDDGTVITGNTAVRGGGIYQFNNMVQIAGASTVITGNTAELGGGCAQNPIPGNSSTLMTLIDGASVYGNRSITTAAGNDFYSAWEGTNTYNQQLGNAAQNTPSITLIAATGMSVGDKYNVWKNDSYVGENRIGEDLISGQYILHEINVCNNLQITASQFDADAHSIIDSDFRITHLKVEKMVDGLTYFDNGQTYGGQKLDDAAPKEKLAFMLLDDPDSGAVLSDKTYVFNEEELHYISYKGKLYEQNQAIEWQPGNDSNGENRIVRSFDTVTYQLEYTFEGDPKLEEYTRDYNCEIKVKVVLDCDRNQAVIKAPTMSNVSITPSVDKDGNSIQIMTGYIKKVLTPSDIAAGAQKENILIEVKGMENGRVFKPTFEMWFNGNDTSPHRFGEAERATVSAAPKYNVMVLNQSNLLHTGYFNTRYKTEVGESEAEDEDVVFGTVLGFGVTVELYNDPTIKGLTGIELPADGMEFDLSFAGKLYNSYRQEIENGTDAPIVWAYKENNSSIYGRDLNSNLDIVSMSWDDEDSKNKNSHYAYGAAPYNSGGDDQSCFDGGGWVMTGSDADKETETKLHVKIDGYKFNGDLNPTKLSGGVSSSQLQSSAVKAFSAGYIQLILPLDPHDDEQGNYGYYQIYMDAVATKMKAVSVTGQKPDEVECASNLDTEEKIKKDLDGMNEYYHFTDSNELKTHGLAVNERRYMDNYINVSQALVLSPGGSGTSISKSNIFNNQKNEHINGTGYNDNGRGDTPLNSTVYIEGDLYFNSECYNTADENSPYYAMRDPRYNATVFNVLEYNYMTGYNILQKFDADAFTVVGAPAVINVQNGNNLNKIIGDSFRISTGETETTWSNVTTQYKLTILYGAKPDGSNWNKVMNTDTTVNPNIEYDDGGAADMDCYREENLMYFRTLDDLHLALGDDAKCVAILYEFRDTVIRSGNTISACAKANVTGEFTMVGNTYCTTNDVRAWYTYRPYYKLDYYDGVHYQNSYQFKWTDMQYNTDQQTTNPNSDDYVPPIYGAVLPKNVFMNIPLTSEPTEAEQMTEEERAMADEVYHIYTQEGKFPIQLSAYTDHYIKSRYRNGVKVGGTHNGMDKGNSILLYSVDVEVDLNVNTLIPHTNRVKMDYVITEGERDVQYRITPRVTIASGANKTALVRNGTQSADIEIDVELPKDLHFKNGSINLDYKYSNYTAEEMNWECEQEETPEGTILHLRTFVSDIDKKLPEILFDCFIGDATDPDNDIKETGTALPVIAHINAKYSEFDLMAAEQHSNGKTINILLTAGEGIVKSVEEKLLELGEDMVYHVVYSNTLEGPTYNIQITDVLPHNNDKRGTNMYGGYRIDSMKITFTNRNDFEGFLERSGELSVTANRHHWDNTVSENINKLNELVSAVSDSEKIAVSETAIQVNEAEKTISYAYADLNVVEPAYSDTNTAINNAPAIYALLPYISGNSRVDIMITMKSTDRNNPGVLLESGNEKTVSKTQMGGCQYHNSFVYRRITGTNLQGQKVYSTPLVSNVVPIKTIKRSLSGVVWMDQDHDGMYNTKEAVDYNNKQPNAAKKELEYPISDIDVMLRKVEEDGTLSPAINVLGKEIEPVKTDAEGKYSFTELAPGKYTVIFKDDNQDYQFRSKLQNDSKQPLPFERLSVTSLENILANRGNRSKAEYSDSNINRLQQCSLVNSVIMPEKDKVPTVNYSSPNWNLGLYYQDLTVEKKWDNMIYGISEGTTIEIAVCGIETASKETVYNGLLRITNVSGEIRGYYIENGDESAAVEKKLSISENAAQHTYHWNTAPDDRIYLQTENRNGTIDYSVEEITLKANNADISRYYNVFESDNTDPVNAKRVHSIINSQILGSVTLTKYSTNGEPLEGAEFSLYQVAEPKANDDTRFYGSKNGVGDTLTESYQTKSTTLYTKVFIGDDTNLNRFKELEMYNEKTNELSVRSGNQTVKYIIHTEHSDNRKRYYYYTTDNITFNYELIIGNKERYDDLCQSGVIDVNDKYHQDGFEYSVLRRRINGEREYYVVVTVDPKKFNKVALIEFLHLPLYDTQGHAIYYTIRETKEPDGYVSLADFNMLTGMNLFDGLKNDQDNYIHDLCFEVENTKAMELPVTGGSNFTTTIAFGTMLICLGVACIALLKIMQKRKRREPFL